MGRSIGEILIPPLIKFSEKALEIIKKIKAWADAHKPLVEMLVKVAATLGVLAAVGGPILLAVSAFLKMKVAITAISVAMKALAASTGPIGLIILAVGALAVAWTTNFGGIRDFTIAVVGKITEALGWLWDKVKWVLEKLGLYKETAKEVTEANDELATATKEAGEKAETAATGVDTLATSMDGLAEKTEEAKGVMDEFGNFLESFDEWTDRLAEEEKQRQEEATKKLAEEKEKQKTILEQFAEVQKSIADRTYELTHTAMEVTIKKLDEEKQSYLDLGMSIEEVNKWYDLEIAKLSEANIKKDEAVDKNEEIADSNTKVADSIEPIIEKLKEAGEAGVETGKQIMKSFVIITSSINKASVALSNFTKEGVAAAIAAIKMSYHQLLKNLENSWREVIMHNSYLAAAIAEKIKAVNKKMSDEINTVLFGYEEYLKILKGMSNENATPGFTLPSYQTGTPYVPKTGLALVHKGEKITPASQNTYNQQKSYSNPINIQPGAIVINTPRFGGSDAKEMLRLIKREANTIVAISRQPIISSHINLDGSVTVQKAPITKKVFTVTLIKPTSTEVTNIEAEHDKDITLNFIV